MWKVSSEAAYCYQSELCALIGVFYTDRELATTAFCCQGGFESEYPRDVYATHPVNPDWQNIYGNPRPNLSLPAIRDPVEIVGSVSQLSHNEKVFTGFIRFDSTGTSPKKIKVYNGVALDIGRLLDTTIIAPNYKQGTIDPLREHCEHDDDVVVIGGGLGVSAVVAAHSAGSVTVFEGGIGPAQRVRETARLNRVEESVTVREAVVADGHDVYGENITDENIQPDELPKCDVLEMDCEGAEMAILENMEISPRVIIVESHPSFDVSPEEVRSLLTDRGYEVVDQFQLDSGNVTFTGIRR